jgi:hypothetical protein
MTTKMDYSRILICNECTNNVESKNAYSQYNLYFCSKECLQKRQKIIWEKQALEKPKQVNLVGHMDFGGTS